MRRKNINLCLLGILCAAFLLAGCAGGNAPESGRGEGFRDVTEGSSSENGIRENDIQENGAQEGGMQEDTGEPRELNAEELEQFTAFMGRTDNYGFLLSQYARAGEVNLNEVLYNGAGMDTEPLSEKERKAYEAAGYTIETDITRLTAGQIEEFLQKKMGIGMADVTGGLNWVYLEEFDSYVFQHGDTNYCSFTCIRGWRTGEEYELLCSTEEAYVPDCVVTLRKAGEDYQFLSNRAAVDADYAGAAGETGNSGFQADLSGIDEGVREQLEVFAEAKDEWNLADYGPFSFGYTVYDLDGDGRLELVTQVVAGTGLFSENHFYRVNASGGGIEELPQEYYAEYAELDIGMSGTWQQAFRDKGGSTVYYLASDWTRNGYAEADCADGAYYLKDGCVYSIVFREMNRQMKNDDSYEETYYDAVGNEISEEAWAELLEAFCRDKEETPCTIFWESAYPKEVEEASVQEILQTLAEIVRYS